MHFFIPLFWNEKIITVRETTYFLNRLKEIPEPLPEGAIMFCFDVVKLYPSIPRQTGLSACEDALQLRTDQSIPTEAVIEMVKTVLDNNIIEFNGKEYKQV